MSRNSVVSVRLSDRTRSQIEWLTAEWGCSMADMITILVDREYQKEFARVRNEPIDFAAFDEDADGRRRGGCAPNSDC